MEKKEISWINYARIICMFLVYFFHTESRAQFDFLNRSFDVFYKPFFINAFFIISGYLLFRKQEQIYQRIKTTRIWFNEYGKDYLLNIFFTLIVSSVVFSTILFFPKILFRHQELNISSLLEDTIGGGSLWFVAALAVAQLLIFIPLLFRKISLVVWGGYGVICFMIAIFLHNAGYENSPWFYQSGLSSVFFIWFGSLIYKIEKYLFFYKKNLWVFFSICYLILVYNVHSIAAVKLVRFNLQGILLCLMSSLILISFCSWLKPNKFVERIGRSTIGLYFLSGAVPEIVSMIVKRFVMFNDFIFMFVVVISFVLSIVLNEFLRNYVGFLFDLRKIWNKKM